MRDESLRDETGKPSASRRFVASALLFTGLLLTADVIGDFYGIPVEPEYGFVQAILLGLFAWAGTPRIASHFGGRQNPSRDGKPTD